mgnify:CR=1 FL=1
MNPLFNAMQINPLASQSQSLMEAYKNFQSIGNPMLAFQKMAQKNPQLQPIMQMLQNGANPETIARQLMEQRGINPDTFIRQLMSFK